MEPRAVRMPEALDRLTDETVASGVFGEPYVTPDGATVIPVSTLGRRGPRPAGVFVVKDGEPVWAPAVDTTRIALLGELIGLVAATLATVAMVRRPPWPDVRLTVSRRT
ncbi:hypothetical protein [Mycolicibacterium goodii]|uniref:Uncharacterized protein n=2 Tax=Mycolicibacterium goodii TaxID=134601 RepID=A0ABS6HWY3_MYCGD|nr:hypothetical protein [Mycolicibacterium goodii]MBU8812638.1 hypothetical protein [Mycolicibacterium goodii]MBU8818667.1 hypothetical protein [Mycolicibacterium goodii]MBU8826194.1 hypothetical protein [Mycolicibacterium goodii]MBU8839495.1 hypothetical protein [Mycolicibacterium goodii]PJK23346.1 hypothetical protein CSX11_05565 [Mycolicibacterium goodii]